MLPLFVVEIIGPNPATIPLLPVLSKLKVTGNYEEKWDEYPLAEGSYVGTYVAKDPDGVFIYGSGEDRTDKYHIHFCPQCGSKL